MIINITSTNINSEPGSRRTVINFAEDSRRDIHRALRQEKNNRIFEEHERLRRQRQEQNRSSRRRRTGVVRLSNTDSISRAQQIRGQLVSKLQEVFASDMDDRSKQALATDIQMQIDRVEQQIAAMTRRKRAIQEEKQRRRRRHDMEERSIYIRAGLLYPAERGGLDPIDFTMPFSESSASVSFNIGGHVGTADVATDTGGSSLEVTL